jgi:hypothetical protein
MQASFFTSDTSRCASRGEQTYNAPRLRCRTQAPVSVLQLFYDLAWPDTNPRYTTF